MDPKKVLKVDISLSIMVVFYKLFYRIENDEHQDVGKSAFHET